jgi:hypothetical protein
MTGTICCLLAFLSCLASSYFQLGLGIGFLIFWGYFFGILKANYFDSNGLFIFDSATIGFYLGLANKIGKYSGFIGWKKIFPWFAMLLAWPVFMAVVPIQHYLIQVIGLRGNIFWLPMIMIGAIINPREHKILVYSLAVLNIVSFGFAIAEYYLGVELFVPQNDATTIVFNSNDVADGKLRIPSIFANAHSYANFMVLTIPWLLGELITTDRGRSGWLLKWFLLIGGLISAFLGVFIAGPRQPVVVLGLTGILIFYFGRFNFWYLILIGLIGLVVGLFVAQEERMQRFTQLQDLEAVQARINSSLSMTFLDILVDYPLGNGMGSGGTSLPSFAQTLLTRSIIMENEFSRILLEQGLPGLVLFVSFFIWFVMKKLTENDAAIKTKVFVWCTSVVVISSSFIGIGLMTTVPATAVLLLGLGFCFNSQFQTVLVNHEKVSFRSGYFNVPAYQRGLAQLDRS